MPINIPDKLPPGYTLEAALPSEGYLLWFTDPDIPDVRSRPIAQAGDYVYPTAKLAIWRAWDHHDKRVAQAEVRARSRT